MKVLGIDPGTGRLGWGIIEKDRGIERMLDYGCLETKANSPTPWRLKKIFEWMNELFDKYSPDEVAVEELFFFKNAKTVMQVAMVRGVVVAACEIKGIPVFQYTPLQVKSAVGGFGRAEKSQVLYMVMRLLKLKEAPKPDDAADALAVALTHLSMNLAYKRVIE